MTYMQQSGNKTQTLLSTAVLALLLASPSFAASDYVHGLCDPDAAAAAVQQAERWFETTGQKVPPALVPAKHCITLTMQLYNYNASIELEIEEPRLVMRHDTCNVPLTDGRTKVLDRSTQTYRLSDFHLEEVTDNPYDDDPWQHQMTWQVPAQCGYRFEAKRKGSSPEKYRITIDPFEANYDMCRRYRVDGTLSFVGHDCKEM